MPRIKTIETRGFQWYTYGTKREIILLSEVIALQLTLHLTNNCNLNCSYCFVERGPEIMTRDIAFAAVKLAMENVSATGLLFYGGEPLLERNLIYDIVDYTKSIRKETGHTFYYKTTTNGTLLDDEFLRFSSEVNLTIGFSHDGPAQDDCRLTPEGEGTAALLEEKIPLLLKYQPYAVGMSVMNPSTIHKTAGAVKFMFEKGFRYICLNLNYSRTAPWTRKSFTVLEGEYKKLAELYIEWTKSEEKFYLSPFDMKILSHLKGEKYNEDRCRLAINQPSVAPDGKFYFSSKYLGNPAFEVGDVFSGINSERQKALSEKISIPPEPCRKCAIRTRCNYTCDSLISKDAEIVACVSPANCAHERMVTPIADQVAEKLYKERSALFIHKHYNSLYPVMSLVEDMG